MLVHMVVGQEAEKGQEGEKGYKPKGSPSTDSLPLEKPYSPKVPQPPQIAELGLTRDLVFKHRGLGAAFHIWANTDVVRPPPLGSTLCIGLAQ